MDTDLFIWPDHTVYYMFQVSSKNMHSTLDPQDSVSDEDREVIADTMKKIEEKTCLDFRETRRRRRKTLVIRTGGGSCWLLLGYFPISLLQREATPTAPPATGSASSVPGGCFGVGNSVASLCPTPVS